MIKKWNLLCLKNKSKLDIGHRLLYEPYKNLIIKFLELCTEIDAKDFDPISKAFDGLLSIPDELKEYYEALLGVTSFYQHSQGGKGKYIEKKLASSYETSTLDIDLSELPLWLENPLLHHKLGIFTFGGLTNDEKQEIRLNTWDWIGPKNVKIDVGNILWDENAIVMIELKNRIDSGGTAARREVWTSEKFGVFANYLISNQKLFRKNNIQFSLIELLSYFKIKTLEIYFGILFDTNDKPATLERDKESGFFITSREGLNYLKNIFEKDSDISIQKYEEDTLYFEIIFRTNGLKVIFGALYGNQIPMKLFRKEISISDLLLFRYDDIWFSQLLAINERMILLKHRTNFTKIFLNLLKEDFLLRNLFNQLINNECDEISLTRVVEYLIGKYSQRFENKFIPEAGKTLDAHIADIVQLVASAHS
ncbi:MAG: hypothetical protein N2560_05475 [Ignavibacteria bacterium]|nr:hypothetical protein [Ignavibacteria bacterium]